jgi:uncharacterized membrane protein
MGRKVNANGHDHDVRSSLAILRHLRGQHAAVDETVRVADVLLERSAAHANVRKRKRGAESDGASFMGGASGASGSESSINGYSLGGPSGAGGPRGGASEFGVNRTFEWHGSCDISTRLC